MSDLIERLQRMAALKEKLAFAFGQDDDKEMVAVCTDAIERIAELEASVLKITADCNAVVCGKSDRITELEAEVARLRVDGERWQAFLNCGCVKLFGWAGVNNKPGEPSYNEVGYVHFGGEFWTNAFEEKYYSAADKAQAQEVLIAFADGAIKTAQLAAKESA